MKEEENEKGGGGGREEENSLAKALYCRASEQAGYRGWIYTRTQLRYGFKATGATEENWVGIVG